MNTPLQSANLTTDDLTASQLAQSGQFVGSEEVEHVHMPNPSFWPLIAGIAVGVVIIGLLFINMTPWVLVFGAILLVFGIMGWALEDPFAPLDSMSSSPFYSAHLTGTEAFGEPSPYAKRVLQEAQDVAERYVTLGDIAWSSHPVKVEIDSETPRGVVLAIYGRMELETQGRELQQALLMLPYVVDVKNFTVAEDALLNAVSARIEKLRASGKLEGAQDIRFLIENFIVSLYGYTPTEDMKYALEKEIVSVPGVRVVINHIGLNEEIPGNLGRTNNKVGKITQ
jgi:hypothetical protein